MRERSRGGSRTTWRFGALLVTTLTALSGCLASTDAPDGWNSTPAATPGPRLGLASGLPLDPRPAADASLAEPPAWRLGEWWTIAFDAPPYSLRATVTRVVAGIDGERYLVGMTPDAFDDGVILLHFPGFGEVDPSTLGFDAHDRPFVPLRFPLEEGATWETQWYTGAPLEARVTRVQDGIATVAMTGARNIALTYDASVGDITSLQIDGYGGYEVVDHGYGHEGPVRVPAGQDLVFCHGRAGVVQAVEMCEVRPPAEPRAPREVLEVADGYDRASFGLFLRDTMDAPAGPGVLHIEVTAPDGSTFEATKTPSAPGMALYPHALDDPGGAWTITAVAGGAGLAILEGVAYRVLDVTLPG